MSATLARLSRLTIDPVAACDGALLDAFLAGDQNAFAALVRRHAALVFTTCRRILRHHQDAEDAFQATFLVLARRAADVWPREAVASWLFGVAHRVALKARGVRNRRASRQQLLEEVANAEPAPVDFDLVEAIHRVICKLPEVYRAAVVACDLEGLSRKEAAERLGWREGTLSGRLARARELLANRLRRLGYTLPASGLTALATTETVEAATIQSTIALATATSAPASVAALTEGVVHSMALFKLKTMTAVVLTACAIGLGVFAAASGAGAGSTDGASGQQTQSQSSGAPLAPVAAKPPDPPAKPAPPAIPTTDRERLQGAWRVVSLTEGDKTTPTNPKDPWVVEVTGGTLRMPYLEAGKEWKKRDYTFALDETNSPRTIDLVAKTAPVGRGIYEFVGGGTLCSSCHNHPFVEKGATPALTETWPLCAPALKDALAMQSAELRLALTIDGKRPTKFGGDSVIVFALKRPDAPDDEAAKLLREQKRIEGYLKAQTTADQKLELEARLRAVEAKLAELNARRALGMTTLEVQQAERQLKVAEANLQTAKAELAVATQRLKAAQEKLAAAEKVVAEASKKPAPAKDGEVFTVHIRTLTAAEKVIRVKATGKETVLDGLTHAADVSIKADAVSVWVVRDKAILPVDLAAITNGDAKTNYTLKVGDQLFVQAKAEK